MDDLLSAAILSTILSLMYMFPNPNGHPIPLSLFCIPSKIFITIYKLHPIKIMIKTNQNVHNQIIIVDIDLIILYILQYCGEY